MPDAYKPATATTISSVVGQPLRLQVLDIYMLVTGLSDGLRVGLAELLQPFLVAYDTPATLDTVDTPMFSFDGVWNELAGVWDITCNGEMLKGLSNEAQLLSYLEWRIIAAGLTRVAGCGVFHAGALTRDEATVLLQGESGAGKTTLTLGLIARGWLPLADDAAIVDVRTLGLRVFPRCFHVEHSSERPPEAHPPLEHAMAVKGHARPLRWALEGRQPTAIITVARDPEQPSTLTPLLRAEAAAALFRAAIRTRLTGSQVADLAARIAATVRYCGHLNNSDLSAALDMIDSACTL